MELREHHINYAIMFLIPANSIISFLIENEKDISKYCIAIIPFIVALIVYKIFTRYKFITNSILYFVCSILCILFAPWDSPVGALFLCLAINTWRDKTVMWQFIILTALTIAIKTIFSPGPTTRILNYIIAYIWFVALYYKKFYPTGSISIEKIDDIDKTILKLFIEGKGTKEIGERIYLSADAINKRVSKLRKNFSCKNNIQMIYYMVEKGYFRHK